jgi:transposase
MDVAQTAPDTVILAGDEASLYLQATLMRTWSATGQTPLVRITPQRTATHFYGALNLLTGQETVLRTPVMNTHTSALFLQQLLVAYPDQPILLLWDRATWHRGLGVQAILAGNPRLELLFFPPGSPDLNPQEHVWKATRDAVSHNHTLPKLDGLADAFAAHLTQTTFASSLLAQHNYQAISMSFK